MRHMNNWVYQMRKYRSKEDENVTDNNMADDNYNLFASSNEVHGRSAIR